MSQFRAPAVPAELRPLRNWLVWRLLPQEGGGKPRKIPYYVSGPARPQQQGTDEDRALLATYDEAVAAVQRSQSWDRPYTGLGFAPLDGCGVVALDFDDCVDAFGEIAPHVEALCQGTYTEISPSGNGVRAFFLGSLLSHKDVGPTMKGPWPIEVFGHNGFVTVTGNITPTCEMFGWHEAVAPCTAAVYEMYRARGWDPMAQASETAGADALMALSPNLGLTHTQIVDYLAALPPDLDYDTWLGVGQSVHQETRGSEEGFKLWDNWSKTSPKYTTEKYGWDRWRSFGRYSGPQRTMASVIKMARAMRAKGRADGGRVDMTDSGNVNALHEETRGDLRYIVERKCFMRWAGETWNVDESGSAAANATKLVAERYLHEAKRLEADADNAAGDDRKRLVKLAESHRAWANYCRNKRGMDNMLSLAARDDRFAVSLAHLDQDRWALGVANGVVDLRTGELRSGGRDDFITKRSPFAFNPEAAAPRWQQFVREITAQPGGRGTFQYRPALASYLHKAVGYWATGSVEEHKMFVAVGDGSNGKSVLFEVLAEVLGPYAVAIPPDAMMSTSRESDGERPTPFARTLAGARLAYGSEAKEGQKLNAAWVKKQTGDARLTARGLHENAFTFDVTHKLALLTNHEPHLDHMDEATRGRFHTIPFDCRWNRPGVPSRDPNLPDGDKHLMQTLLAEGEGILAWIISGAVAYARDGLEPPPEVSARTLAYFAEQDAFGQWMASMERCSAKAGTGAATLFGSFQAWCVGEGVQDASPSTQRAFASRLQAQGIESARVSSGTVWGLRTAPAHAIAESF